MFEEQGLVKPKTPKPKQKHRPKSVLREESCSENHSKGSSTRKTELMPAWFTRGFYTTSLQILMCALISTELKLKKRILFSAADNLSNAQSGSNLSLASGATNEADSVNSGGAGSQRYELMSL